MSGSKQSEKSQSYMREEMAATAEKSGKNPNIARGMVDEELSFEYLVVNGDSLKVDDIEGRKEGKLITLTTELALKYGIADGKGESIQDVLSSLGINEYDLVREILSEYNLQKVDKFIQEIFWRTYWRGWLELHPKVFDEYEKKISKYEIINKTGIKCFDNWTDELIETGYLHNHARMWYASIWIFTLKRPWEEGAHFFSDHLLDFCPASNTLGWRWVAGLQTIGKNYLANSENIKKFTNNRFYPKDQLNEFELPIEDKSNLNSIVTVSYTHLTLPTKRIV